jgi:hypothetical protein
MMYCDVDGGVINRDCDSWSRNRGFSVLYDIGLTIKLSKKKSPITVFASLKESNRLNHFFFQIIDQLCIFIFSSFDI